MLLECSFCMINCAHHVKLFTCLPPRIHHFVPMLICNFVKISAPSKVRCTELKTEVSSGQRLMHPLLFHHVVQGNCRYFARNSPATGLHQGISHGIVSTAALQDGQPDIIQSSRDEHGSSAAMRRNSEPNLGMGRKTASEASEYRCVFLPLLSMAYCNIAILNFQQHLTCNSLSYRAINWASHV